MPTSDGPDLARTAGPTRIYAAQRIPDAPKAHVAANPVRRLATRLEPAGSSVAAPGVTRTRDCQAVYPRPARDAVKKPTVKTDRSGGRNTNALVAARLT